MSDKMAAGKKKYQKFMDKNKAAGKSHAESLDLWRKTKGTKEQPESTKVSSETTKPKSKKKSKPKTEGFTRPKSVWDKLRKPTTRQRVNIQTIQKIR